MYSMEKVFTISKTANAMKVTTQTENVPEKEFMFTPTETNTSASSKTDGRKEPVHSPGRTELYMKANG